MKNILKTLIVAMFFMTCSGNYKSVNDRPKGTVSDSMGKKNLSNDSLAVKVTRVEDDDPTPHYEDVVKDIRESYSKIELFDKVIVDGKDSLQVHEKFYCLHDSSLIIPKRYVSVWNIDDPKDFVTHNFASKIAIIKNRDTIFNKVIKRSQFDGILIEDFKKYATFNEFGYVGYNKINAELAFEASISIPLTDVLVPAYFVIDKKGNYRILDQYAKMDFFKQ